MLGTIQGYLLQFNQKPLLIKPTSKCEVKVPKAQESMMTSEASSMLSEGTKELGPGNKGFFQYPSLIPKKNAESHFIMSLKSLNQYITCTKFKMTTLKQIREAVLLNINSAYCHIPLQGDIIASFASSGKAKSTSSRPCLSVYPLLPRSLQRSQSPFFTYIRRWV